MLLFPLPSSDLIQVESVRMTITRLKSIFIENPNMSETMQGFASVH